MVIGIAKLQKLTPEGSEDSRELWIRDNTMKTCFYTLTSILR
jgi:hypothetical protein